MVFLFGFGSKPMSAPPGPGQFVDPSSVAVDSAGNIYVGDQLRVSKFDDAGKFELATGPLADSAISEPAEVALDFANNVYVADAVYNRVVKYDSFGNFKLQWGSPGSGPGQFYFACGVAVDSAGNVYVTDVNNYRVQKFDSAGNFKLAWGSQGSGNGQFLTSRGAAIGNFVAVDSTDNVYVTDPGNFRVQKFDSAGNFKLAWGSQGSGNGQFGWGGGPRRGCGLRR
jgi:tripartite motif-containing protein 71